MRFLHYALKWSFEFWVVSLQLCLAITWRWEQNTSSKSSGKILIACKEINLSYFSVVLIYFYSLDPNTFKARCIWPNLDHDVKVKFKLRFSSKVWHQRQTEKPLKQFCLWNLSTINSNFQLCVKRRNFEYPWPKN